MKKYIAKTNVSVNVVMPSGKNKHISFSALTSGGSVYYTDSADEQAALEGHYKYGKLFKADEDTTTPRKTQKKATEPILHNETVVTAAVPEERISEVAPGIKLNEAVEPDAFDEIEDITESSKPHNNVKVVTDFEDARNWLSETYGVSRTKIRSLKAVKEYAESVGVELQGI